MGGNQSFISRVTAGRYDTFGHYVRAKRFKPVINHTPLFYSLPASLEGVTWTEALLGHAEKALTAGPFSVVHKADCAPSGAKSDYYSIGAYWWPNPDTQDGLPYVNRDCDRNPATELYSDASKAFDKTSLQQLIDAVTALTLAGMIFDRSEYKAHAIMLLKVWFLDQETAMAPHLMYAQVHPGHRGGRGAAQGIIEARDMVLLIDMILLLKGSGDMDDHVYAAFKGWFTALMMWLEADISGKKERAAANNHGTNYDLLYGAIARFVGDGERLSATLVRSEARVTAQIWPNGKQPHELKRPHRFHYCAYNLQSWLMVLRLMEVSGMVTVTIKALLTEAARDLWIMMQGADSEMAGEGFVPERLVPILTALGPDNTPSWMQEASDHFAKKDCPSVFHPYTGIPPFWQISAL